MNIGQFTPAGTGFRRLGLTAAGIYSEQMHSLIPVILAILGLRAIPEANRMAER